MTPAELKPARTALALTQQQLADELRLKRLAVTRYEGGARRIPGLVDVTIRLLTTPTRIPLVGTVAAGDPLEVFPQTDVEMVEVPAGMVGRGETFALRVKGTSMRDEGIFPGDVVVVQRQSTARNGQTVIAIVNGEATIKIYHRKAGMVELHPANDTMKPIVVKPTDTLHIAGIVVGVIRHLRK
ncbi:MAG: transcriptional repressor LexA [Nitrospirae bacterium]|nr:transcriptional repressor LexA [Nitrospirota bacterium]MDE3038973.1 transcriptional repressor LexA [Nitrospirota bacterium]MDE3051861.1 transcriptional repressor LexA [Nitrospirota bacterium]MDE3218873.1 transcriptional repressor LexA [Nitrospirota bacterium]